MNGRRRIYLAWPDDRLEEAFGSAVRLALMEHVPIMQACAPEWSELDRQRLSACDCLVRFSGESLKCDFAVDSANVLGLPVYFSLQECLAALPTHPGACQ